MFTVVSSFQSTVALYPALRSFGKKCRFIYSFGHYGHGLFDGSNERHIRSQEHGRQHFFAATPFALCIQTQGSAIHPFPVGKGEGIGNRFSRLVVCRDKFPLFFHSFFSPLNNLCHAAAVLQWRKHSMLPVFPIQQRGNSQNVILSQSFYPQPEGYVHAVAATADVHAICLQPCPFLSR